MLKPSIAPEYGKQVKPSGPLLRCPATVSTSAHGPGDPAGATGALRREGVGDLDGPSRASPETVPRPTSRRGSEKEMP